MTDDCGVSTEIQVDDETRAALLLFNERVEAAAAHERGVKRIAKAVRAKDEAAAVVRKVGNASKETKEEAEAAYKDAVEQLRLIEANPNEPPKSKKKAAEKPEADSIEAAAEPEPKSDDEGATEPEPKSDDEGATEPETSADNESTEEEPSETPATAS